MAKAISAKGEEVDFDLLKIKQQIAGAPKSVTVKARESYIDQKFKRRLKRQTDVIKQEVAEINTTPLEVESKIAIKEIETPIKDKKDK